MTRLELDKLAVIARRQSPEAAKIMRHALQLGEHVIERHLKGEQVMTEEQADNLEAWLLGQFGVTNAGEPKRIFMTSAPVRVMTPPPRYQPAPVSYGDPMEPRAVIPRLRVVGEDEDEKAAPPKPVARAVLGLMNFGRKP